MTSNADLTDHQRAVRDFLADGGATRFELADEFDVADNTAKYYIRALRDAGVGVEYDRDTGQYTLADTNPAAADPDNETEQLPNGLVTALEEGGLTYDEFEAEFGLSREAAQRLIEEMQRHGYAVEFRDLDDGTRLWYLDDTRDKEFAFDRGDGTYTFALISDTHLGSQTVHLDELNDFYDRLVDRGIDTVFHAGDISDGYEVYRHHVNALEPDAIGWQRLREYVATHYPERPGITTYFITGNHDYKFYKRNGLHFGKLIDEDRRDLEWLGEMQATIVFDADAGIDLELIHPSGGAPYTVGYRAQTLYRERPPENRPTLAGIGHLHDKMQANAEGVEAFYTGAWQGPTPYIIRKGLPTKIGGWIVDLEIVGGSVRRLKTEWIGYDVRGNENSYDVAELTDLGR